MAVLEWRSLVGGVWNKTAHTMISEARQIKIDNKILAKNHNNIALTADEQIQLIKFNYAQYVVKYELETHAICEARERKRNAQLGLPPTVSEIQYIVETPDEAELSDDFLEDV